MAKKSVAIIGEGETEWFYFESMRILKRYSYQLKPTFPKHSDWRYIFKQDNVLKKGTTRFFV